MIAFHEIAFPLQLAQGATGGPERRTEVVTLGSGREERNTPWAHARRRYDVAPALRGIDDVHRLIAFFEARRGRLYGFRFRDATDWRSCAPGGAASALDQPLGTGDGATRAFQLTKTYGDDAGSYVRPIRKPADASVIVAIDGVTQDLDSFSADITTGIVTFDVAPANGAALTAGFAFDTPVRFDADRLDLSGDPAARKTPVPLIELIF